MIAPSASTTQATTTDSVGAELALLSTASNPGASGASTPGTCDEEPNPLAEWMSEPGCPPGTSTAAPVAVCPPFAEVEPPGMLDPEPLEMLDPLGPDPLEPATEPLAPEPAAPLDPLDADPLEPVAEPLPPEPAEPPPATARVAAPRPSAACCSRTKLVWRGILPGVIERNRVDHPRRAVCVRISTLTWSGDGES